MSIDGPDAAIEKQRAVVAEIDPDILRLYPPDDYVACFEQHPDYALYRHVSGTARTWNISIESLWGDDACREYHKLALLTAIGRFDRVPGRLTLTDHLRDAYAVEFARMIDEIETAPEGYHGLETDGFLRDLAMCRQKLYPIGAGLLSYPDGIPRRMLFADGFRQFARGIATFGITPGGYRGLCTLHMDRRLIRNFTPKGWRQSYLVLADLLDANPKIRGVTRSSWFIDPALEEISPKLTYLRTIPAEWGARVFYNGSDDEDIANALTRSKIRRELFKQGAYRPKNYLFVWPRRDFLRWAAANRSA